MKNIFKSIAVLAFSAIALTSCEEDTVVYGGENAASYFESSEVTLGVTSSTNSTEITVITTNATNADRVINVSVDPTSTAAADQYNIVASSLVIPAGEYIGTFTVTGNYDALVEGESETVILKLDGVEGTTVNNSDTFKITMFKTCPIDLDALGTNFVATVSAFDEEAPSFTPTVTRNGNVFTFNTLWGPSFVAWATGNSSYEGQYLWPGTMTIDASGNIAIVTTGNAGQFPASTGIYDSCNNVITYTLNQGLFSDDFTVDVTLTPQ